ncbi:DUF2202 domain-containing protein [Thermococcus sp.]
MFIPSFTRNKGASDIRYVTKSESTHVEAVRTLLKKYNLTDPTVNVRYWRI